MSDQIDFFDLEKGEKLKDAGMAKAARTQKQLIAELRAYAIQYSKVHGFVHGDITREYALRHSIKINEKAWGSVFRKSRKDESGKFVRTGEEHKSRLITNHARRQTVWRWQD